MSYPDEPGATAWLSEEMREEEVDTLEPGGFTALPLPLAFWLEGAVRSLNSVPLWSFGKDRRGS